MFWHCRRSHGVRGLSALRRCRSGTAALEFALVSPMLVLMLFGILAYGGYFYLAHTVQQIANDAARAAVAGLSASERLTLADQAVQTDLQSYSFLAAPLASVSVNDGNGQSMTVTVTYDASTSPFWSLQGLVPMPSSSISRAASIALGGY
jgi:Flp pilus assembly protein TadG